MIGPATDVFPRASSVGALALELAQKKQFLDIFKAEPAYLQPRNCNVTR